MSAWTKEHISAYNKAYRQANIEKVRKQSKDWKAANRAACLEKQRAYYHANKEISLKKQKQYCEENKEAIKLRRQVYRKKNWDRILAERRLYYKKNPGKVNVKTAKRRAKKLQRTPKWLSKDDIKQIASIYREASKLSKITGIPHHVDHIIPLVGNLVSGLHVPSNLQILRYDENCRKSNKFVPGETSQIDVGSN
jgi:5-methylcytosine-specific restriction endonuclease McrA